MYKKNKISYADEIEIRIRECSNYLLFDTKLYKEVYWYQHINRTTEYKITSVLNKNIYQRNKIKAKYSQKY